MSKGPNKIRHAADFLFDHVKDWSRHWRRIVLLHWQDASHSEFLFKALMQDENQDNLRRFIVSLKRHNPAGTSPVVVAGAPLLPVVGDFKSHAVRVAEEGGTVVRRIVGVGTRLGRVDAGSAQLRGNGVHICDRIDTKAEVMQAR